MSSAWPGQIVTFDVDRVWKGQVQQRFVLYNSRAIEGITFQQGQRYVVFAHWLKPRERERLGLPATAPMTLGVAQCGDGTLLFDTADRTGMVRELGVGRPPA